ncbi:ParA family protein [Rheinheimera sp.]|jgi:cellulose biosynthesis protein BcsQ|uniref:ParA family protein n=1 Tax=Rheinheimera sp. TaxID=1869214 RepID=UPI002639578B|nr:ParA family protein [Rheinheimera sp.]MCA1931291.1 ParA family protein [Rheinheimera sp.]
MQIVSLYNHKGGVSKTTTTFNLAHYLAEDGKKVLLVDADPQCNLTELCMGNQIEQLDEQAAQTGVILDLPGTSILDVLKPRIEGTVPEVDISLIETVQIRDGLDLIRGSVDLTSVENDLAEAHTQRFAERTNLMRTYVAIGDMLERFGKSQNYDYILIDLGPSAGALTRSFFLACDSFFVPIAPDRFSVQAIETLSSIVGRWLLEHSQIKSTYMSYGLPVKHGTPVFLGVISQFFKVYKSKPKAGFGLWMSRIPQQITRFLIPILNKHSIPTNPLCSLTPEQFTAVQIPDFGSLAPLMQEVSKPIFGISQEDTALITESGSTWGGGTWNDAVVRMATYKECFRQLAGRLSQGD